MADHLEDDEQIEALKRWWDENGKSTLVAVALAVAGTVGWQQYQGWTVSQAEQASEVWESMQQLLTSTVAGAEGDARELADLLKNDFSGSAYAQFAAMRVAALDVAAGDLDKAEGELRWALAKAGAQSELGQLIQLRLARVLAAQDDDGGALAILEAGAGAYPAAYAIARGDIHMAAGRDQEALDAYLEARAALLALGNPPGILDIKINSLEARLAATEEAAS
jgi:predicted negative regulator of RcsB-dependent stress response